MRGGPAIYTLAFPPSEYINCENRLCYNGGIPIANVLRTMVHRKTRHFEDSIVCRGYEGSPNGRRKYRDCLWFYKVVVDIAYKPD